MTSTDLEHQLGFLSEAKRQLLDKYFLGDLVPAEQPSEAITQRLPNEPTPLSFAQEQLWYREQIDGIPPLYNEAITLQRTGTLDIPALESSLAEIFRRHEIWRTTYRNTNGIPVQVVHPPPCSFRLEIVDLRAVDEAKVEPEILRLTTAETRRRFDLEQGPLIRAMLLRPNQEEYRLFLVAHLSIVDGVSVYQVFPSELATLYAAFSSGKTSPLPEPAIQYADYACWQRRTFTAQKRSEQLAYWRGQLGGEAPILQWPSDHPRPIPQTYRGAIRRFVLSTELAGALKNLSRSEGVTLFTTLLASFTTLLYGYTGQQDLVIGTPSPAGRKRPETQSSLGYFLNPIALRIDLHGDPSFTELLARAYEVLAGALCHDDVPLEVLAEELQVEPDTSRNPFFTVAISLQPKTPETANGWIVTSMDAESGGAPWDLYLAFIEEGDELLGRIQYNPDLFEAATITYMLNQLQLLMKTVTVNPGQPLPRRTSGHLSAM